MNAQALFDSFEQKRVLVIGDLVVDINTYCECVGVSAETPTLVLKKILDDRNKGDAYSIGGAGLVVRNLLELGA